MPAGADTLFLKNLMCTRTMHSLQTLGGWHLKTVGRLPSIGRLHSLVYNFAYIIIKVLRLCLVLIVQNLCLRCYKTINIYCVSLIVWNWSSRHGNIERSRDHLECNMDKYSAYVSHNMPRGRQVYPTAVDQSESRTQASWRVIVFIPMGFHKEHGRITSVQCGPTLCWWQWYWQRNYTVTRTFPSLFCHHDQ